MTGKIQRLARGVYARETERDASMPQRDADVCGQGQAVDPTGAQLELYQYSTEQHQSQEAGRAEFSQLPKAALSRTLCWQTISLPGSHRTPFHPHRFPAKETPPHPSQTSTAPCHTPMKTAAQD